jgi:D-alanine-D-alanine ligase
MAKSRLNIAMICDAPFEVRSQNEAAVLIRQDKDWKDERDVQLALEALGHRVRPIVISEDLNHLFSELSQDRPDLVFCMFETFRHCREQSPNVAALLELLKIPYTGASPRSQQMCGDKALAKKIMQFHKIPAPDFRLFEIGQVPKLSEIDLRFPVIVKPQSLEGSEGIHQSSIARTTEQCQKRIKHIHQEYNQSALVEQFIDGREIYVGMLGNQTPTVLKPRELVATKRDENAPLIASWQAKWSETYRKRNGIKTISASSLPKSVKNELNSICSKTFHALSLAGYARLDLRLTKDGQLFVIEANPNPSIAKDEEFAKSARQSGISYNELIASIVDLALNIAA